LQVGLNIDIMLPPLLEREIDMSCKLSVDENNEFFTSTYIDGYAYGSHFDITKLPRVLSLSNAFFQTTTREAHDFYTPRDAFKNRIGAPLTTCVSDLKNHFFRPYASGASFFDGFAFGFFIPSLTALSPAAAIGACLSALGELVIGMGALLKSLFYLAKGDTGLAKRYALDGITRVMLSPVLAIVSLLAMPVEVVRFFTRTIVTLFELVKDCCAPRHDNTIPVAQPVEPQQPIGEIVTSFLPAMA
jgi:hypothetical protein